MTAGLKTLAYTDAIAGLLEAMLHVSDVRELLERAPEDYFVPPRPV